MGILEWGWRMSNWRAESSPELGLVWVTETWGEWREEGKWWRGEEGHYRLGVSKVNLSWHWAIVQLLLPPNYLFNYKYSIQKKQRDCYPPSYGNFLILSSSLFQSHSSLPSHSRIVAVQLRSLNPFLDSQLPSLNMFWFLCLSVCILNECPVSPSRWMGLFMVFSHPLLLEHNRLENLLAGEMNSRTTERSSSYRDGQRAFTDRGSISGKVPWHKGAEQKLRIGWAA